MARNKWHQGYFKPQNPKKYSGDSTQIIFRSSWELRAMKWFDSNPAILKWNSEGCVIPYMCPTDNQMHRYFMDFAIQTRKADGKTEITLVEIKPAAQRVPPKYKGKQTKSYIQESVTYMKNCAKWKAANAYCAERGWKFVILDEYDLGLKQRPKEPLNG